MATHILCSASASASAQGKGDFLELTKGSVPKIGQIVSLVEGAACSSCVCQDLKERRCVDEQTRGRWAGQGHRDLCASAGLVFYSGWTGGGKQGTNRRVTGSESSLRSVTQAAVE